MRRRLERLAAEAPDLNPVEAVWSWLRSGPLSNYVPDGVNALDTRVIERLVARKESPKVLRQLRKGSKLPFPEPNPMQTQQPADQ